MLKKRLGMILGFLILILAGICYFEFRTPEDGENVDHYLLSTSNGIYCGGTKTGSVELTIKMKRGEYQKMFVTSDDVTKNGEKKIVDDRYLLRVYRGTHQLASTACETDSLHDHQKIKIFFTTVDNPSPSENIEIVISKNSEKNVVLRIKCSLNNDSMLADFSTVNGTGLARISASGIFLDLSNPYFSRPDFQSVGSLSMETSSGTLVMPLNHNISPATFKDPNILHPAVLSQGGSNTGTYVYALDLANWQNIQYLTLKSATAGSIWMIRKDLLDDLLYVFGTIVYQEDGVISIVQDNVLYKAPLPNSQKDTSFDLGTSVYIFYSNKRKQDYGYDLSGVLAVTE